MKAQSMIEVIDAFHQTIYVESEPFPQRGAFLIIGPPGVLKSTFIEIALEFYPSALILSDLNISSMAELRHHLISNKYSTIAFTEYEKLYQRKKESASNMEGVIMQLIEQGFTKTSFETQDAVSSKSRVLIMGALTYECYLRKIGMWNKTGFSRRVLFSHITLQDPNRIMQAVREWKKINIDGIPRVTIPQPIPMNVTEEESVTIEKWLGSQYEVTVYALLKKAFTILKWKYRKNPKRAYEIFKDFAPSLSKKQFEPITF